MELQYVEKSVDTFEICPRCGEWRMRARCGYRGWEDDFMYEYELLCYDLRCLNCGYRHRECLVFEDVSVEEGIEKIISEEAGNLHLIMRNF